MKAGGLRTRRFSLLFLVIGLNVRERVITELPLVLQALSSTPFLCFSVLCPSHRALILSPQLPRCSPQSHGKLNKSPPYEMKNINQEHALSITHTCAYISYVRARRGATTSRAAASDVWKLGKTAAYRFLFTVWSQKQNGRKLPWFHLILSHTSSHSTCTKNSKA